MILVKHGDFVISGINVEKGAMSVYQGLEDITATIHYSSYTLDKEKIDIEFLKYFLKSDEFKKALKEQVPGGIKTEIKPKHLLPLVVEIPKEVEAQREVVEKLNCQNQKFELLHTELTHQQTLLTRLRQSILQEAVHGQLTAQWRQANPHQEPASELLRRIQAEKAATGKKERPLPPVKAEEMPFELPEGWVWCRLGDVVDMSRGRFSIRPRNDPRYFGGKYPFIQIGSLDEKGSVVSEYEQTLNEDGRKASKMFPKGTIAIAIVGGTIANLGVLGIDMCFTDSMVGIVPTDYYNQEFILNFLRFKQPEIKKEAYQMAGQPNIKIPTLANLVLPLPPLPEQTAIVAQVERLLGLVGQLEAEAAGQRVQAEGLLQAALREAMGA
jgi:type I restriction enzyme S subunit